MAICKIIINRCSGHASRYCAEDVKRAMGGSYDYTVEYIDDCTPDLPDTDFAARAECKPPQNAREENLSAVAVCGGDGTLNRAVNRYEGVPIYYFPSGTLNEFSKTMRRARCNALSESATACGSRFVYVMATGSFTDLGWLPSQKCKQRLKSLGYVKCVLKAYKVHRIGATIVADGRVMTDEYTLIMLIDSSRCFGLNFNGLYVPNDSKLHLLTIKAPKGRGFAAKIRMFFPFFRAFFGGFSKEIRTKNINFISVSNVEIRTAAPVYYCVDGDCSRPLEVVRASVKPLQKPLNVGL